MTDTIIHIDLDALDERLANGERWAKNWGNWKAADGETCLHGAIRYCQPVPGDAYIIEQVSARYGFGTKDNDNCGDWACIRAKVIPDITDDMLADTFGPQWQPIVALVRRAATLTANEATTLAAAGAANWAAWAAGVARWTAARTAAGDANWAAAGAAGYAARPAAWAAARDAARALAVRDLIGQHGLTQQHYDTLTGPWAAVIGPAHPDDTKAAT